MQEDHDECCNPGTFGKSLADYLQQKLEAKGYEILFIVAEDFGWWIEIGTSFSVPTNIVLRRSHERDGPADFAIAVDSKVKKWSWKRFRFVDLTGILEKLASDVREIIDSDPEIELVADHFDGYPDYPLGNYEPKAASR
ncbi:MAG: hypothetical protein R3F11_29940 [Verrucomicrobiales bacterium]